jgi:hypothetical protein
MTKLNTGGMHLPSILMVFIDRPAGPPYERRAWRFWAASVLPPRSAAGVFYVFWIRAMTTQPEKLYCPLQHQAFEN